MSDKDFLEKKKKKKKKMQNKITPNYVSMLCTNIFGQFFIRTNRPGGLFSSVNENITI